MRTMKGLAWVFVLSVIVSAPLWLAHDHNGAPPLICPSLIDAPTRGTSLEVTTALYLYPPSGGAGTLNTTPPRGQPHTPTPLTQEVRYIMSEGLRRSLTFQFESLVQTGSPGMTLFFLTNLAGSQAEITAKVYDQDGSGGESLIAEGTAVASENEPLGEWELPAVAGMGATYTMPAGHKLVLSLSTSDANAQITYAPIGADRPGPYLRVYKGNALSLDDATLSDAKGTPTSIFQPNIPVEAQRVVFATGAVMDAFGVSDIDASGLTFVVTDSEGTEVDRYSTEQGSRDSLTTTPRYSMGRLEYQFVWGYDTGLPPTHPADPADDYTLTVKGATVGGNPFSVEANFDISPHGVWIHTTAIPPPVPAGGTVEMYLTLTNSGGESDTLAVGADPRDGRWSTEIPDSVKTLSAGAGTDIVLRVTAPEDATEGASTAVTVTGRSEQDSDETFSLELMFFATTAARFTFTAASTERLGIDPGSTVSYQLTLTNTVEVNDTYELGNGPPPADWRASLSRAVIDLGPDMSAVVYLNVTAPELPQEANAEAYIDVSAKSREEGTVKTITTHTTTTAVTPTNVLRAAKTMETSTPDEDHRLAKVTFRLDVTNPTSSPLTYAMTAAAPSGWTATFDLKNVNVQPQAVKTVVLSVTPEQGAPANDDEGYPVTVRASAGTVQGEVELRVRVAQYFALSASIVEGPEAKGRPGEEVTFAFGVTNEGNGADQVSVTVVDLPKGWSTELDKRTIPLERGGRRTVTLTVSVGESVTEPEQEIVVVIESSGPTEKVTLTFLVTLEKSIRVAFSNPLVIWSTLSALLALVLCVVAYLRLR